jgi:hypothetical protein
VDWRALNGYRLGMLVAGLERTGENDMCFYNNGTHVLLYGYNGELFVSSYPKNNKNNKRNRGDEKSYRTNDRSLTYRSDAVRVDEEDPQLRKGRELVILQPRQLPERVWVVDVFLWVVKAPPRKPRDFSGVQSVNVDLLDGNERVFSFHLHPPGAEDATLRCGIMRRCESVSLPSCFEWNFLPLGESLKWKCDRVVDAYLPFSEYLELEDGVEEIRKLLRSPMESEALVSIIK